MQTKKEKQQKAANKLLIRFEHATRMLNVSPLRPVWQTEEYKRYLPAGVLQMKRELQDLKRKGILAESNENISDEVFEKAYE